MNKLEELAKKCEELGKEIEKLKQEQAKELEELGEIYRANYGDEYFFIDDYGDINQDTDRASACDDFRFQIRNYFKTEEDAKIALDKILVYFQLQDIAKKLNGKEKIDWNDKTRNKYYIYFDNTQKILDWSYCQSYQDYATIYCLDPDFFKVALEEIGENNLKLLFKV